RDSIEGGSLWPPASRSARSPRRAGYGENDPLLRANRGVAGPETRRVGLPTLRSARRGAAAVHPSSPLPRAAAPTAQDTDGHTRRRRAPPSSSSAERRSTPRRSATTL